jgi:PPK2 family polyphosphate:nucleotide phosphotransferase
MPVGRYRIAPRDTGALGRIRPADTGRFGASDDADAALEADIGRLDALQERLYAQGRYALLIVFQGMDAAGKDSAIKHVLSGVNPQGTEVHSFKQPSAEELSHDFLWRAATVLPARGRIGIFNRSYYEDVATVRVHPEFLAAQHLPAGRVTRTIWHERFEDINAFERHLWRSGTLIVKFFLHVSRRRQSRRLLRRLDDPAKHWKFSPGDIAERRRWRDYQRAYGEAIGATSRRHAPWYVVPADHKWYAHFVIARVLVRTLARLDLSLPAPGPRERREMDRARRELVRRA